MVFLFNPCPAELFVAIFYSSNTEIANTILSLKYIFAKLINLINLATITN